MKALFVVVAILLALDGCMQQSSEQLTPQQIEQIKSDITTIHDSILTCFRQVNLKGMQKYYLDSPEFYFCGVTGEVYDYKAILADLQSEDSMFVSNTYTSTRREFPVVTKDLVVFLAVGDGRMVFRSGEELILEHDATTYVFKKVQSIWKIACAHESATLKTMKPVKK